MKNNQMYAKRRVSSDKRKIAGGALLSAGMGVLGMGVSLFGKSKEKKRQEKLQRQQQEAARVGLLTQDMNSERGITQEQDAMYALGNPDADLYAIGGSFRKNVKSLQTSINQPIQGQSMSNISKNNLSFTAQQIDANSQNFVPQNPYLAVGGKLKPIANGTDIVNGNTHESNDIDGSYGVTLNDGNKDIAEVEHGEVVKNDNVFSDRLKFDGKQTYAQKAKSLATQRGKLEKQLDMVTDKRKRNSLDRQISILNNQEHSLYVDQESTKLKQGLKDLGKSNKDIQDIEATLQSVTPESIPNVPQDMQSQNPPLSGEPQTFADGGGFFDSSSTKFNYTDAIGLVGKALPIVDNVFNAFSKTPKLPTPLLAPVQRLDNTVNIEPQKASINRAVNASINNIMTNTNSSQVARAGITNARLKGASMIGELRGNRDNTVRGINNQNAQMLNQKAISDYNTINQNNSLAYQRAVGIKTRQSGNFANLVDDIKGIFTQDKLERNFDENTVNSILSDKTGNTLRSYLSDPYFVSEMKSNRFLRTKLEDIAKNQTSYSLDELIKGGDMYKGGTEPADTNTIPINYNLYNNFSNPSLNFKGLATPKLSKRFKF